MTYAGAAVYDFVNFSSSARAAGLRQVLLNEQPYGFLMHGVPSSAEEPAAYLEHCRPVIRKEVLGEGA